VAAQSPSSARRLAALDIMNIMRQHSPVLVEQSRVVSEELLRVAILWHEMWHEGLEEASRYYYTEHNVEAMLGVLEPLHAKVEAVSV
jgi:serine/threonine-protein kinase mTOR